MGCIRDTRMATVNLPASSPAPGAGRLDIFVSPLTAAAQAHEALAEPGRPPRKPAQRERGSRSSRGGSPLHPHPPCPPRVPLFRSSANDRGPRARCNPSGMRGCLTPPRRSWRTTNMSSQLCSSPATEKPPFRPDPPSAALMQYKLAALLSSLKFWFSPHQTLAQSTPRLLPSCPARQ